MSILIKILIQSYNVACYNENNIKTFNMYLLNKLLIGHVNRKLCCC